MRPSVESQPMSRIYICQQPGCRIRIKPLTKFCKKHAKKKTRP